QPGRAVIEELLAAAGVAVNGSRPFDIQVKHPQFYRRVLQQGSLGLGESYMDGWWECERLDIFFQRVMRAGLEYKLPRRWRDILYVLAARLVNYQS
ncbi:cyclopropane-fatty-acyl-phospholipid synthase, partial [Chromobacterium piscinae]